MTGTVTVPWYAQHDNLILLTAHLAEDSSVRGSTIAHAVEKPWNYEDEFRAAWAIREHETATDHAVHSDEREGTYYCGALGNGKSECAWFFDKGHVGSCDSLTAPEINCDCGTDAVTS
jgi:hypothetical protein